MSLSQTIKREVISSLAARGVLDVEVDVDDDDTAEGAFITTAQVSFERCVISVIMEIRPAPIDDRFEDIEALVEAVTIVSYAPEYE